MKTVLKYLGSHATAAIAAGVLLAGGMAVAATVDGGADATMASESDTTSSVQTGPDGSSPTTTTLSTDTEVRGETSHRAAVTTAAEESSVDIAADATAEEGSVDTAADATAEEGSVDTAADATAETTVDAGVEQDPTADLDPTETALSVPLDAAATAAAQGSAEANAALDAVVVEPDPTVVTDGPDAAVGGQAGAEMTGDVVADLGDVEMPSLPQVPVGSVAGRLDLGLHAGVDGAGIGASGGLAGGSGVGLGIG